jgi:hypothetical protein
LNLSGHVTVWVLAIVLASLAPAIVRAYAGYLGRRTRARADRVVALLFAAPPGASPVDARAEAGHGEAPADRTT